MSIPLPMPNPAITGHAPYVWKSAMHANIGLPTAHLNVPPDRPYPNQYRTYLPFRGPFDPCPPLGPIRYVIPPDETVGFQPPGLPQFSPREALKHGTLWPLFYSPYPAKEEHHAHAVKHEHQTPKGR